MQHGSSRRPAKHQVKNQQIRRRRRSLRHAHSGLVGSLAEKATYNRHTRPDPWLGDREGAEAPGTVFQGLPVISDCTGRAHPLGRGFAHLTAEPAPLGHRQRVDHAHGVASGVSL